MIVTGVRERSVGDIEQFVLRVYVVIVSVIVVKMFHLGHRVTLTEESFVSYVERKGKRMREKMLT